LSSKCLAAEVIALAALWMVAGCGANSVSNATASPQTAELQQIWDVYTSFVSEKKRAPARLADVKGYGTAFPEGLRAVQEGRCVVVWGLADPTGAGAKQILAYEKEAPIQGGLVLFGDGTIKSLTAEEFREAPKGKG
jgi:hypothetical protein